MHPIAFEIGPLTIHFYGVMAALGLIAAALLMEYNRRFARLTGDQATTLLVISLLTGILGARIFYVVQFFEEQFAHRPEDIIRIDKGGLVFYGGFLLATLAVVFYCKMKKLEIIRVLDVFVPALAAGHGFGRIGCFLHGCCFGEPTTWWWGVKAPAGSFLERAAGSLPIHPVQLVEAGENFILCAVFCWLLRRVKPGVVTGTYFMVYGVLRFFNETLRGDNRLYWHLTPAQWIGIMLTLAGAGLLIIFLKKDAERID